MPTSLDPLPDLASLPVPAPVPSRFQSFITAFISTICTCVIVLGVLFVFRGQFNQIESQRSYALGVTCAVVSADNGAIVKAISNSHGYYNDPALAAFLHNPRIAPVLKDLHFPTLQQEEALAHSSAKAFNIQIENAIIAAVGHKGSAFITKRGTINCSALKKATIKP